jgi:hypothetical protein
MEFDAHHPTSEQQKHTSEQQKHTSEQQKHTSEQQKHTSEQEQKPGKDEDLIGWVLEHEQVSIPIWNKREMQDVIAADFGEVPWRDALYAWCLKHHYQYLPREFLCRLHRSGARRFVRYFNPHDGWKCVPHRAGLFVTYRADSNCTQDKIILKKYEKFGEQPPRGILVTRWAWLLKLLPSEIFQRDYVL